MISVKELTKKYADRNWEKGYAWGLSVAALRRHLAEWLKGESIDPETGAATPNQTIVVQAGKITAIDANPSVAAGAEVIDLSNQSVAR